MKKALWLGFLVAAIFLVQFSTASSTIAGSAGASSELLPNLRVIPVDEVRLLNVGGKTYLRFSVTTWNDGLGPLEVVAGDKDGGKQKVYQRVYNDIGGYQDSYAGSFDWHEAHGHVHVNDYAEYTLQLKDAPGASKLIGSKTTFCILDTDKIDNKLPGAPKKRIYRTCDAEIQGMSVGWGDTYGYYLPGQEIDITGLAYGQYTLTIVVDPKKQLLELDELDNSSTVDLDISITNGTVEILGEDKPRKGKCPRCSDTVFESPARFPGTLQNYTDTKVKTTFS